MSDTEPVVLGPNQSQRFYQGGDRIAAFRGLPPPAGSAGEPAYLPEDWVGSVTPLFGTTEDGLSRLPDGRLLRDAIGSDPATWLSPQHVQRFGASTALLVKLLDAGQRLPVHCHPSDAFAQAHLASAWGKTEAWIILDAAPGSEVHLGFTEPVPADTLARWVDEQDPAMLTALHRLPVAPGDAILVPAGLPHAIGAGVFLVELQEPTDLSVLLEWGPFRLDGPAEGHLGLGFDTALTCVDRSPWEPAELAALRTSRDAGPAGPVTGIFPAGADPYFTAQRVRPGTGAVPFAPSFAVLVVLAGSGLLRCEQATDLALHRGMTVLVPYGAGPGEISGDCELIRCLPPSVLNSTEG